MHTGLLSNSYANRSTDHDDVDDENVGSTTTNKRGTPTYHTYILCFVVFLFAAIPISTSIQNLMYNADGNGDLERGRGPRGLCSAQLCSAPREFYSSAVVVVVGFCDFVKMVAYILHSRSVFLFHQLPPLCAIVHNATAGCHISKPFARSAAPAQLSSLEAIHHRC